MSNWMPEIRPLRIPEIKIPNPAEDTFQYIVKSIIAFERRLKKDEEIGARWVSFGGETVHITDVGFMGREIIKFHCKNSRDEIVELIQHVSQVNVMLVAVKAKTEEPLRIGFVLEKSLKG
ncbi:MAG: hypothetical protein E5X72_06110 [Mesorhizobium sp.]|uniref:DUF6173 family protein n=1 Tax=Mesorhizobium sp. TaxID=1871066 RepID=UPI00121097BC|nr:DUF6173 family protein [Mesorhizobium sp.]TIP05703.1 MAG: hypothetical protein E5X72_06110 [Mesorhizobium sp.]